MSEYFDGCYYKHQKDDTVLSIIAGKSGKEEFIQIITKDFSYNIPFIGDNYFSEKGIRLNIKTKNISLSGEICYLRLTPIKYDIMGPFKYFPMQCRHGIISMGHTLKGKLILNNRELDFTDGIGYMEKDSGVSFPSSYAWVQANDFDDDLSIMASVAKVPFMGLRFLGSICVIIFKGKEYRLATYLGSKILSCTKNEIILKQRNYKLVIKINENTGCKLNAPNQGKMTRKIVETVSCKAEFDFYINHKPIFKRYSAHTSFEFEE